MTRRIEHEAALERARDARRKAAARRIATKHSAAKRGWIELALTAIALALLLAAPADASAAGTVQTDQFGDVFYQGDATRNVVSVTTTVTSPTQVKVVISEPGIAEGGDVKKICSPEAGSIACTLDVSGNVTLNGSGGDDRLTADGPLEIRIEGDDGADELIGGDGRDLIVGGSGVDELDGRVGDDTVVGGPGADTVRGGVGDDSARPDLGDGDVVDLGPGRDAIHTVNVAGAGDVLTGGPGTDLLIFQSHKGEGVTGPTPSARVDLANGTISWQRFEPYPATSAALVGIEDAMESHYTKGDDTLIGDAGSNLLGGGFGNDTIVGGPGADTLLADDAVDAPGSTNPGGDGVDTIDAVDGFEDRIDCGGAEDSLVGDQFDPPLASGCESTDVRHADPFGIAPPVPSPPPPAPGPGDRPAERPSPDVRAPSCSPTKPAVQKRATFLKRGYRFALRCDERARVDVTARVGKVVLDSLDLDVSGSSSTVAVKVPRSIRKALGRRFTVGLRIDATDRSGNRATQLATFKVR